MEFNLENPLTNSQDLPFDTLSSLFLLESDHMPCLDYINTLKAMDFDVSFRQQAISSIFQMSGNFNPFLSYLAVNYLDRFLSSQEIPQPEPWVLRLLAISCVSLAAKMTKTDFFLTDIQGGSSGGLIFEARTIQRMEMLILGALKWRMRSITPFSFISFFISLFQLNDPTVMHPLKARATEVVLKAQTDIKFLEYKPSIIAAAALLSASNELFPSQFSCFRQALSNCSCVSKENMWGCFNAIQDTAMEDYQSAIERILVPLNVLDRNFSSSESENMDGTIINTNSSSSTTVRAEREIKRRKMSGYCDNQTLQLSQTQQC